MERVERLMGRILQSGSKVFLIGLLVVRLVQRVEGFPNEMAVHETGEWILIWVVVEYSQRRTWSLKPYILDRVVGLVRRISSCRQDGSVV